MPVIDSTTTKALDVSTFSDMSAMQLSNTIAA
jgi:hypothetical protein